MKTVKREKLTGEEIDQSLYKVDAMLKELTQSKLVLMGKEYNLNEWLTLSDYARKYNLSIAHLEKWIMSGIVPTNSVIVVPELNHLKLIKDQIYETGITE